MPKGFFPCICHDEDLMLAPQCMSHLAFAELFLQEQRRMDFARRLVHEHLPRNGRKPYKSCSETLLWLSMCFIPLVNLTLSSPCSASFTKAFLLVLKIFSESIVQVSRKKSRPGLCGGSVSTFTAPSSQRSSPWPLQRSPTCYIWSTWTVRLLQRSSLMIRCPLHPFSLVHIFVHWILACHVAT